MFVKIGVRSLSIAILLLVMCIYYGDHDFDICSFNCKTFVYLHSNQFLSSLIMYVLHAIDTSLYLLTRFICNVRACCHQS